MSCKYLILCIFYLEISQIRGSTALSCLFSGKSIIFGLGQCLMLLSLSQALMYLHIDMRVLVRLFQPELTRNLVLS